MKTLITVLSLAAFATASAMAQAPKLKTTKADAARHMRYELRDDTVLGPQPWWRTQNWCLDARGVIYLCRQ
jgi:hypothetical protein